jgi:alkylated DNA repair dioxygenase AlkB
MEPFEKHIVFGRFEFFVGRLPADIAARGREEFEHYWRLHPEERHRVRQPGTRRSVPVPRWQQAYEKPYKYTGSVNGALPLPALLRPYLTLLQQKLDPRLNGVLLNWYDAAQQHYIGPHRDSPAGLVVGSPIVTISLGADRCFRLLRKGEHSLDFTAQHGSVFIVPWDTNLEVKHAVPQPRVNEQGRRVSITLRAFR